MGPVVYHMYPSFCWQSRVPIAFSPKGQCLLYFKVRSLQGKVHVACARGLLIHQGSRSHNRGDGVFE